MKKSIKVFYQKTIAIMVSVSFVITILLPKNSFAVTNTNSFSSFIPASLGKVTSAKFYDSQDLIVNIQDLHCHAQTQRNITAILEYLDTEYNIDKIYLEGAYKNINTKWLSDFKKEETGTKILENLVDTGRLSGTEYYSIISDKNEIITGIEDENLYKENIKLLGEIINKRQEIEKICLELEQKIDSIKKEYFKDNKEVRNFINLTTKYKNKKINSLQYYKALEKIALDNNISLKKYHNLTAYINLLKKNNNFNKSKVTTEIKIFLTELKSAINYQDYIQLLNESNSFKEIANISRKLLILDDTYKISDKLKLKNFNYFLQYIELSKNINPIEFMNEETNLTDIIFSKLAKNKYEHEVVFLSYCLPKIKDYFLADITAQNYHRFNELFVKFKKILLSYSSADVVSKLDKYQDLLLKYYKNNIKRDEIFAKTIVKKKNETVKPTVGNTSDALKYISDNFKGKKIKLVVTGGFHTAGLEKTLENNRISYIVITPKVTENIDKAKEIYADTVKYNANILTNSINIEALSQESLKVSFPKILNNIFDLIKQDITLNNLNNADILTEINKFVDKHIKNINDNVKVLSWEITEGSPKDKNIKYSVTYLVQNGEKEETETIEYTYPFVRDSNEKVSENKFEEAVIFKDLFKSIGEKTELLYKTVLAPIIENFVFLWVPFLSASISMVSPDLTAVSLAVTAIFGIIAFPLAHLVADYFKEDNGEVENRSLKKLIVPSILFTSTFIAFSLAFPGHSFIAFVASTTAHSIYNALVLKGIIKKLPLALIDRLLNRNVTIEDIDKILNNNTSPRHYKIDMLEKKLFKSYPSNKEVSRYIIEKLYEMGAINNKEIPYRLKSLFNNYVDVKEYFLTIENYDAKSKININRNRAKQLGYIAKPLHKTVSDIKEKINIKEFELLDYYIGELEELEDNVNADTLPVIKLLIKGIVELSFETAKQQNNKAEVKILLEAILPLYNQVISFYDETIDMNMIEIIRDIAINNIDLFDTVFDFLINIYKFNKDRVYIVRNGIKKPIIILILDLLDYLNETGKEQSLYLEQLNDIDSFNDIVKNYKFNSEKNNKELNNFIFNGIIDNCTNFTSEEINEFCEQMPVNILNGFVKMMYEFVLDDKNDFKSRQIIAKYIGTIISKFSGDKIEFEYIDIDKLNSLYGNNILEEEIYLDGLYNDRDRTNVNSYFSFTPLLKYMYKKEECSIKRKLIYTDFIGDTKSNDDDIQEILKQLKNAEELRYYNDKALEDLNILSNNIKNQKLDNETIIEQFNSVCDSVKKMIENFEMIDIDGESSEYLMMSFNRIREDFDVNTINEHFKIGVWEENRLYDISSIHSLINAVHQMSAVKFIENISELNFINTESIQKISSQYGDVKIEGYNLSDKKINKDILDLFNILLQGNDTSIDNFIIHNDELYWTRRLRVHSISVQFDFKNKSINLSFTESANLAGNKLRLFYFKNVLQQLGFKVVGGSSSEILTIRANIDKNTGINNSTDFTNLAKQVILLFRHSDELDIFFDHKARRYGTEYNGDEKIISIFNGFIKTFFRGFMWFNYEDKSHETFKDNAPLGLFLSTDEKNRVKGLISDIKILNKELEKFNLEPLPIISDDILESGLITQEIIDEYINIPLEKAFADGRIVFDKNSGNFVVNENFNFNQEIINHIETNEVDSIKQAEILNFIDINKFNFNTVASIGGLILKKGYIKLSSDKFLSVQVLIEPNGKNFKYAHTELITLKEKRENLKYEELSKTLNLHKFNVPERIGNISVYEQKNRRKLFDKELVCYDTSSVLADGVSSGNGNYIVAKISYDKNKADKNTVWLTPYTTIEDMDAIEASAAIITTTGGKISHASIVTNELGIPSVNISNGIWRNGKLYAEDFLGKEIELKEETTVLLNGETGHILIFDDIENITLNKLQQYIDKQNTDKVIEFLKENENNENLNKLLEYIFFQLSGNSIIEILNSQNISNNVKDKLQTLITVNLKQAEHQIEETILNIKGTDNIIVKYMLVKELDKKIENINNINSGLIDKYTVYRTQVLAGVNSFISTQLSAVDEMSNLAAAATDTQKAEFLIQLRKFETLIPYLQTKNENEDLEKLKKKISILKEDILNSIEEIKITDIKSSNEKLTAKDFTKYGAKFINTAITSKLVREENIQNVKVPEAYGISEDVLKLLFDEKNREKYEILNIKLNKAIEKKDISKAKQISQEIVLLIENNISNKNILEKQIEQLDDKTMYAVRSSGIGEDEGQSFAGMGKTNLNVTKENIVDSVIDSWKSFYSNAPIKYMVNNEKITKRIEPCIMLQSFIIGDVSGVVFSRNKDSNSIISAGYGLGEGVVSNTIPVDNIETNIINNGEKIKYTIANKTEKFSPKANGGTIIEKVNKNITQKQALSNKQIKSLMKVIKSLENSYGYPIDVEWTIKDGVIYILQVRPITILNRTEQKEKNEGYILKTAASILDNLFSNKTTGLYKYWTTIFTPAIETLLFIVIPFILFATNPLGFWIISVIGFALSHLAADIIINKTVNPLAQIRSFSDITKIGAAGVLFTGVFLAINILFPGYSVIAFIIASITHSIYNYLSTKTNKLPAATIMVNDKIKNLRKLKRENEISKNINFLNELNSLYDNEEIAREFVVNAYEKQLFDLSSDELANDYEKFSFCYDTIFENLKRKRDSYTPKFVLNRDIFNIFNDLYLLKNKDLAKEFIINVYENDLFDLEDLLDIDGLASDFEKLKFWYDCINSSEKSKNLIKEYEKSKELKSILDLPNIINSLSKQETVNLLREIAQKQNYDNRVIKIFSEVAVLIYDKDNSKHFKDVIEITLDLANQIKDSRNFQNKYEPVFNIIKVINSMDNDNEKDVYFVLKQICKTTPIEYINSIDKLFSILGTNKIVLENLFEALKTVEETNFELDLLPNTDVLKEENINLITNNVSILDMRFVCLNLFNKDIEIGKEFTELIIKNLQNNIEKKNNVKKSLIALGEIYSAMYENINTEEIMSIEELNNLFKENKIDAVLIKNEMFLSNLYDYDKTLYKYATNNLYSNEPIPNGKLSQLTLGNNTTLDYDFNFTPLIKNIQQPLFKDAVMIEKSPIFIKTDGVFENKQFDKLSTNFTAIQNILKYNYSALKKLNDINSNSSKEELLACAVDIEEMINYLELINKKDADMCRTALEQIKEDIEKGTIINHKQWYQWNEKELNKINTLHTLINAVHQTSISDFKNNVKDSSTYSARGLQTVTAKNRGGTVKAYKLSKDGQINNEISDLISNLALDRHNVELYVNNSMVVWSCKLLKHSVDIIINFDDIDRGIKVYYSEGHNKTGNKYRMYYFSKVLEKFGFNVETNIENIDKRIDLSTYSIEATLNAETGLTSEINLAEVGSKIIKLFEYSINLDIKLENIKNPKEAENIIDDFINVFDFGEIDSNYDIRIDTLKNSAPMFMPKPSNERIEELVKNMNNILDELGLAKIPKDVLNKHTYKLNNLSENKNNELANFFQKDIDEYFNKPIEQAYIQGKIKTDENGNLVRNEKYNDTDDFLLIFYNQNETVNVTEIIKNIPECNKSYYNKDTITTIKDEDDNKFIAKTASIKLKNGWIYIKEFVDPVTNKIEKSQAEFVSYEGRKILSKEDLKQILEENGYFIHETYPIGKDEKNFDIEKIYKDKGIEWLLKEIELWKQDIDNIGVSGLDNGFKTKIIELADKLYIENKDDAEKIIYTAYKLDLFKYIDYKWNNIKNDKGIAFFYNSIAKHYPNNKELAKAFEDVVNHLETAFDNIDKKKTDKDLYKEIEKTIKNLKEDLQNKDNINEININVAFNLLEFFPSKLNANVSRGNIAIEDANNLITAIIPLYNEAMEQGIIFNDRIFKPFKDFALLSYSSQNNYSENTPFYQTVELLMNAVTKTETTINRSNQYIVEIAKNIKSEEDTKTILTDLRNVSSEYYILASDTIFKDIGLNETTLKLLLKSLKKLKIKDYKLKLIFNSKENLTDLLINEMVKYSANLDMGYICHYVYFEFEKDKEQSEFTKKMIKELAKIVKNKIEDSDNRKDAAFALGQIYSIMYEYADAEDIVVSIDELNEFYKSHHMNCFLIKNGAYIQNFSNNIDSNGVYSYDHINGLHTINNRDDKISDSRLVDPGISGSNFRYTNLVLTTDLNIDDSEYKLKEHAPSFIIDESANIENEVAAKFDALNKLLKYNLLAIDALDDVTNSEDKENSLNKLIDCLEKMIDCMEVIDKEHADKSRISLEKIKKDIKNGFIDKQVKLNTNWNEDSLDEIDTLHTLINAVHQTSFKDLTYIIKQHGNLSEAGLLKSKHKGTEITIHNFSNDKKTNNEIKKLIHLLSLDKHNVELFVKDGTAIWTKKLLAHSVDIIMNFSEPDRGIKIYYNEGGATPSNEWRIEYFTKVLTELGFSVETNTNLDTRYIESYVINANLDKDSGLNNETNLPYVAATVMKLFEYSVNFDVDLERSLNADTEDCKIQSFIEGYAEIFNNGEMASNYDEIVEHLIGDPPEPAPNKDIPKTNEIKKVRDYLNDFLRDLGLSEFTDEDKFIKGNKNFKILDGKTYYIILKRKRYNYQLEQIVEYPEYGKEGRNFFQKDIDEYFNKIVERAFIAGIIMFNSEGKLVINENYDFTESLIEILKDKNVSQNTAKIISSIPEYSKTYYKTENKIKIDNNLVPKIGVIKLSNGNNIYIKELIDIETGNVEYAQAELVTYDVKNSREVLSDEKLKEILEEDGFEIEKKNTKQKEIKQITEDEHKTDKNYESDEPDNLIKGRRISEGEKDYYILEATFDRKDEMNENKVFISKFTTTEDDDIINRIGGVITTTGSMLSHVAIVTRENNKPSLIIDEAQLKQDENGVYLEIIKEIPVKTESKKINNVYIETYETKKETIKIRQGDKILMSSKNGFIVKLSDDENKEVEEIDNYINNLKQQNQKSWEKQIIDGMSKIAQVASGQVAEILFFNLSDKITKSGYETDKLSTEFLNRIEEEKNNIFDNVIDSTRTQSQEDKDNNDELEIENILSLYDLCKIITPENKNYLIELFGGKTVELAEMIAVLAETGIEIPKGFGIGKNILIEYLGNDFIKLNEELKSAIAAKNLDDALIISGKIKELIDKTENKEIETKIAENLANIDKNGNIKYAVRSSGIGEDGREYSFAGMGESELNVESSKVSEKMKKVLMSFYDKKAIEYMVNSGQFVQPAVLVQEMVDADYAGVIFSKNQNCNSIINITEGLGDKLVEGTISSLEIEVDFITGKKRPVDTNKEDFNEEEKEKIKKVDKEIDELYGIVNNELEVKYPIDVEFAFKNGKVYILQRRADTKFSNVGREQQADIKFVKEDKNNISELFCVEYENKSIPVWVDFDKKNKQITFVVNETDNNFSSEDENKILMKIQERVNTDIVVRTKVNRHVPIFNNIAPGKLEIIPPNPIDKFEITDDDDFDELKNSKNVINILEAA